MVPECINDNYLLPAYVRENNKTRSVKIRLTESDFSDLELVSQHLQISLSACFRMVGLEGLRRKKSEIQAITVAEETKRRHQSMLREQLEE